MSRYFTRDQNHKEICDDLAKMGVCVWDCSKYGGGVADIITHKNGKTVFIEIKVSESSKVKRTQLRFLGLWLGYCGFATNIDEAFNLASKPEVYALTYDQKMKLLGIYETMKTKEILFSTLKKKLESVAEIGSAHHGAHQP